MKATQKFVAGAVCPSCNEQDSLLIDSVDQSIECVDCGYTQNPQERDTQAANAEPARKSEKVDVSNIIRVKNIKS